MRTWPVYRCLHGTVIVVDKQPDGDSVRFVPASPGHLERLARAHRLHISADGSVQLRFEGVDAPEAHFEDRAQPLGWQSRDRLLARLGFSDVVLDPADPTRVVAATPPGVPAAILAASADANGRPIAYLLAPEDADAVPDGAVAVVDADLLARTVNHALLTTGDAYPGLYTTTPPAHRAVLRTAALAARAAGLGVWAIDRTAAFWLEGMASLAADGQLVLPKLFRRCVKYLQARAAGFDGSLPEWLVAVSRGPRDENDAAFTADGNTATLPTAPLHLADLLTHTGTLVRCTADPVDLVFVAR